MDALLVIRNIEVQNANAVSGVTWGFPGITNFIGFVHSLSRNLNPSHGLTLDACGIVVHQSEVQAYGTWQSRFSLTRNPLKKDGSTAPFNEEARMRFMCSLIISCSGDTGGKESKREIMSQVRNMALSKRLAGGSIISIGEIEIFDIEEDPEKQELQDRRIRRKLLPGFALIDRSDLLREHFNNRRRSSSMSVTLDAWLDFVTIIHRCESVAADEDDSSPAVWTQVPKPGRGWLVPIMIGYRAISPLYNPNQVIAARDSVTPFRFVESAYSVGEWIGPHRVREISDILWRYEVTADSKWYLCRGRVASSAQWIETE